VLVGEDEESLRYIDIKTKRARNCGIIVSVYHLEANSTDEQIEEVLTYLNGESDFHGIIVQLPLPGNRSQERVDALLAKIDPHKDVDGLASNWISQDYAGASKQDLMISRALPLPPMVAAVCLLLDAYDITLQGKKIVVVGKGRLVG